MVNGKKNVQWPAFYCRFPSEVEKHNTVKVQNDTHWVSHNSTIPSTYCCSAIQSIHMFFYTHSRNRLFASDQSHWLIHPSIYQSIHLFKTSTYYSFSIHLSAVFSCLCSFYASTYRAVENWGNIPSPCAHTWTLRLILILITVIEGQKSYKIFSRTDTKFNRSTW